MVNNYQYVNIREILSRILRHPLLQDLNLESAIQYAVDFFGIMGLPSTYINKEVSIDIDNYRGVLPCDLISINQVKHKGVCLIHMTDNFSDNNSLSFKTQGSIMYTSFKNGTLDISYKALPVDDEGFPLLPDEPTFLRALELYIKKQWFTILFDMNKISPVVLQNTQQEYAFAAGACNSTFITPSVSEMEAIKNMWNQLIPRTNEFKNGFKSLGYKEYLKF
jgi:hypothetical protein